MRHFPLLLLIFSLLSTSIHGLSRTRPNFVFILSDDQDALFNSSIVMPYLQKYLVNEGLTFESSYVSTPICCARYACQHFSTVFENIVSLFHL